MAEMPSQSHTAKSITAPVAGTTAPESGKLFYLPEIDEGTTSRAPLQRIPTIMVASRKLMNPLEVSCYKLPIIVDIYDT